MTESYEQMLDRALGQIPKTVFESARFQIPEAEVEIIGNRTIIRNLKGVATAINREPNHLMKYLLRELGAAGDAQGIQAVFQGKFSNNIVNERIRHYVEEFVLCRECGKPDTKLERRERIYILRCEACGARTSVRGI